MIVPVPTAQPLRPDAAPGGRPARVDWAYTYRTWTKVGHHRLVCTVYPQGKRVCVLVTK